MTEHNSPDQSQEIDEPGQRRDERKHGDPEVSSPRLDHLQQTIDDARDAAKAALRDQSDV